MKIIYSTLIILGGLVGPFVFWFSHSETISNREPIPISLNTPDLMQYEGKMVYITDACMLDYVLQTEKNGVIEREIIPLLPCDSEEDALPIKVFLRIEPPEFFSVQDIYDRAENSEYSFYYGKLHKSLADLTASSARMTKEAGFEFDENNVLQLVSHFNPWEQYVEIWFFLVLFPLASIILVIKFNRRKKQTSK